jgi:RNA polymerase sigma-70 factor (ECF subfamily)
MPAVLEAVYGTYAITWHSAGTEVRRSLADEALYLAETLAELAPDDAEVRGLAALITLSSARTSARFDTEGRLVPLAEQDVELWDAALIERGTAHLRAAHARGDLGRFQLEAAIQSVHIARRTSGATDWRTLRDLHRTLDAVAPTLGGSIALAAVTAEIDGPAAGLELLDASAARTGHFQPAWSTRAHLLDRLGRRDESVIAYDKAISLTIDPAERAHLTRRRDDVG